MADDEGFRPPDDGDDDTREAPWRVREDVWADSGEASDAGRADDRVEAGADAGSPGEPGEADDEGPLLRFDDSAYADDRPHWTDPPTGELPRLFGDEGGEGDDSAWASFAGSGPVWRDQHSAWEHEDVDDLRRFGDDDTRVGSLVEREDDDDWGDLGAGGADDVHWGDEEAAPLSPDAATAGGGAAAGAAAGAAGAAGGTRVTPIRTRTSRGGGRSARPTNPAGYGGPTGGVGGRNLPVAIGVGVALAAAALILFSIGPGATMVLVTAVLVGAAAELYAALRKVGYQPATLLGLASVAGLALAAYWRGEAAYPLVLFLAVTFALLWFLFADTDARPVPNLAVTLLGIGYVGVLGAFAALLLKFPDGIGMLLGAIIGTVAYDIGGLFVGSSAGRSRLAPSVSPNKTYEGLAGGMVCALLATVVITMRIEPWTELGDALALGVVLALVAPLGDLAESMVKRDLDIKDMGSILPGHGGLLDRFDALLFTLPATYYLVRLLELS